MTNDEEEKFIHDQLITARQRVEELKAVERQAGAKRRGAEHELAKIEQAAIDYMTGNGIVESELFRVRKTEVVDVESVDAVPEEFVRTKITREPDKRRIADERPTGNWYTMKENTHIMLRSA